MLTITQGDSYVGARRLIVTVVDENGAAVDLTDTTMRFMVKRRRRDDDADALISLATPTEVTLASPQSGATKGKAYISLDETDTDVVAGAWFYELEATDAVGIITLAAGRFIVAADLIQGA